MTLNPTLVATRTQAGADGFEGVGGWGVQNLMRGEPLKLVDGGKAQRTFLYIKDAIQAVMLMIVRGEGWVGLGFRV